MGQFKELDIEIQDLLAQDETPVSISALLDVPVSLVYDSIHMHELCELLEPATVDL
jgi:hypothetical protein